MRINIDMRWDKSPSIRPFSLGDPEMMEKKNRKRGQSYLAT